MSDQPDAGVKVHWDLLVETWLAQPAVLDCWGRAAGSGGGGVE